MRFVGESEGFGIPHRRPTDGIGGLVVGVGVAYAALLSFLLYGILHKTSYYEKEAKVEDSALVASQTGQLWRIETFDARQNRQAVNISRPQCFRRLESLTPTMRST